MEDAATGSAATTAAGTAPPAFRMAQPHFIDFGCGVGNSMRFAEDLMGGPGVGLEIAPAQAAEAQARGREVAVGDMLRFTTRSVAQASFAIDVLPELQTRREFEAALIVLLRAARDFALVQHLCFDSAEALLARGETTPAFTERNARMRPRAVDYLHFVQQHRSALNLVGLAAFGIGAVRATPSPLANVTGALLLPELPAYRSIRVIIGRKEPQRFRAALDRAAAGKVLLFWEAAAAA